MSNLHHTMSQKSDPYLAVLEMLKAQAEHIKQSGPVAPAGVWLNKYSPGKGRPTYVRKRSEQALWEGKKTKSLGQLDSDEHRAFELAINRRNALQEIERRTVAIQWPCSMHLCGHPRNLKHLVKSTTTLSSMPY